MARSDGTMGFTGSLGNISAYRSKASDGIIIRTKGGPSAKKVKHHKAFANTRRNNKEFGGASSAAKALRNALYRVKHMSTLSVGHINKLTRALANRDTVNEWGKRAVCFSETRHLLDGFNLNKNLPLGSMLMQPVNAAVSRSTGSASLKIPALVPGINFKIPPVYQLYRFVVLLGVIPDFACTSTADLFYRPVEPVSYRTAEYITAWFAARENVPEQHIDLQLRDFTDLPDCHSLVLCLAIEFGLPISNQLVETISKSGAAQISATG